MQVLIDQEELFRKAMDRYRYFVGDEQARLAYEARQKFLHDQASYLADARDEGREIGREEGKAEGLAEGVPRGRREGKLEIADTMKNLGFTTEQILEVTGLSESELEV